MPPEKRCGRAVRACRDSPLALALALFVSLLSACGGDGNGITIPLPGVASVEVTSPIGGLMAVGRTVQLSATAKDANGNPVTAQFTWSSSNPAVASVSNTGQVQALTAGPVTITATASNVDGSLQLRAVATDLPAIGAVLGDNFADALVASLTSAANAAMQASLSECSSGVSAGNLEQIQGCLASALGQVGAATDPTDRALLAVFALFLAEAERVLNL